MNSRSMHQRRTTNNRLDRFAMTEANGSRTLMIPVSSNPRNIAFSSQALFLDPTTIAGATLSAASNITISAVPVTTAIYVSSTAGAPGNPGTINQPLASINAGIAASVASGWPRPPVLVEIGTYQESPVLSPGVSVTGGYQPSFSYSVGRSTILSGTTPALADGIQDGTFISNLEIIASPGTAWGESSIPLIVRASGPLLRFDNCRFVAQAGAPGLSGFPGPNGVPGGSGFRNFAGGGYRPGGDGGTSSAASPNGSPAPFGGGAGGLAAPASCSPGGHGGPGASGVDGPSGIGATTPSFSGLAFLPAEGNAGQDGAYGLGGGGGGMGGNGAVNTSGCNLTTGPVIHVNPGGGGGAGGQGGIGGAGGFGGGGSFASVLIDASPSFSNCTFVSSSGGLGGAGGMGGVGGAGGTGAQGFLSQASFFCYMFLFPCRLGGTGGTGGTAGSGGGGAGGPGGPSHLIAVIGVSTPTLQNAMFLLGNAGAGGLGGAGGQGLTFGSNGTSGAATNYGYY